MAQNVGVMPLIWYGLAWSVQKIFSGELQFCSQFSVCMGPKGSNLRPFPAPNRAEDFSYTEYIEKRYKIGCFNQSARRPYQEIIMPLRCDGDDAITRYMMKRCSILLSLSHYRTIVSQHNRDDVDFFLQEMAPDVNIYQAH